MKKLLLLGGTADGRVLAETLHKKNIQVIYSIAGLVRTPKVACDIISGGFSQYGGLDTFVHNNNIDAILDVTHPYAQKMSTTASVVAKKCSIPYWRFHREAWVPTEYDQWYEVEDYAETLVLINNKAHWNQPSILLTAGQLPLDFLQQLPHLPANKKHCLRTAVQPDIDLPDNVQWIKAIGPFSYKDELELMKKHQTTILLSKNSGGDSTVAKLQAARTLSIPVIMLKRPTLPTADKLLFSRDACKDFVVKQFAESH